MNNSPSLKERVDSVKALLDSIIVYNHSGESHPDSHGLSVYLPLSLEEGETLNSLTNKRIPLLAYNPHWLKFVANSLVTVAVDQTEPTLQSERYGDNINAHILGSDIKNIFVSTLFLIQVKEIAFNISRT